MSWNGRQLIEMEQTLSTLSLLLDRKIKFQTLIWALGRFGFVSNKNSRYNLNKLFTVKNMVLLENIRLYLTKKTEDENTML